jgi:(S)-2-hydroxyglutarate dehydrogenase
VENGLDVTRLSSGQVSEVEPHVHCLQGIKVSSTGIINYQTVCLKLVELIGSRGSDLRLKSKVVRISSAGTSQVVHTDDGDFEAKCVINCAGLHSDRVALMAKAKSSSRIVPFRGEYYELVPERRHLVKGLIYPVPNPDFPFLGVHFTRMIDGSVHAGPNAVLSLKREGYSRTDFSLRDFTEIMLYPGFWKLAAHNMREGLKEMYRSFSKAAFVRSLQRLIPQVSARDLIPSQAGVRAQALQRNGSMVDDFLIVRGSNDVHVINAPSPAATASLEIGEFIAQQVLQN